MPSSSQPGAPRRRSAAFFLLSGLAAALFAGLCALGLWQLERAADKEARQAAFEAARASGAVWDGRAGDRPGPPSEFARVDWRGRYDGAHQFLQDNRTLRGRAGYYVLTPFRPAAGAGADAAAVLVNRGWVPAGPRRDALPDVGAPAAEVRVRGTVRLPREDLFVLGDTGYEGRDGWPRVVQRVELDPMRRALGYPLAGWLVALDPDAPHGYAREWRAAPGMPPARHRAYAFQWFALAAALFVIWAALGLRRR